MVHISDGICRCNVRSTGSVLQRYLRTENDLLEILDEHRAFFYTSAEAAVLVERNPIVICDDHDPKIIAVSFLYHIKKLSSDALTLVLRINEYVLDIRGHYVVVHNAYHSDQSVTVPGGENGTVVCHGYPELFRIITRFPVNRQE